MHGSVRSIIACAVLALIAAGTIDAHDIWLLPRPFVVVRGDTLVVEQLVGSELEVEAELELMRTITRRFELLTSDSTIDLLAELPDFRSAPTVKPVLERKLDAEGQALVVMDHAPIENVFTNQQFVEYLDHEEFDRSAFREHMGDRTEQIESYSRTLKSLVRIGDVSTGDLHRRVVGQTLEVLLLQDPFLLDPGDELEVQVLFENRPLQDHLVTAFNGDGDRLLSTTKARTDDRGIVRFVLTGPGLWLVRLVHLYPATDPYVNWESYWTSYTFEVD